MLGAQRVAECFPSITEYAETCFGCVVREPEMFGRKFVDLLPPCVFVDEVHKKLATEIAKQWRIDQTVAPERIAQALRGKLPDGINAAKLLLVWASDDQLPSTAYFDAYAEEIRKIAAKRERHEHHSTLAMHALNGWSAEQVDRANEAAIYEWQKGRVATRPPFTAIIAAEFANASYELNYLAPGLLVEGQPTIAAASKKGMKTSVLMDYSIAQSVKGNFLGYFPISEARRVLFCSGESGPATLQETARRQCNAAGYDLASLDNLVISTDLPKCGIADNLEDFRTFIADQGAEVVIVDPAYLCFPSADAGNVLAQGELLRGLNDIIAEQKATLILVHHTKKLVADPYGQPELENIAWAGFQEYARQWWLLGRREAYVPGSGIHRLWLSVGGSAGHGNLFAVDIDEGTYETIGGRYWRVNVHKASDARSDAQKRRSEAQAEQAAEQLEADRAAICRAMANQPTGATKTWIRDHAGISGRRFPAAFAAMIDNGELIDCEVTISNQRTPRAGFKLNTTESA